MSDAPDITVTFQKSGVSAVWDDEAFSLLEFAEAQGLEPDFSCRSGICGTCMTRLISGEVAYFEDPLDEPDDGHALICCSKPVGDVTLDL